jgi:hypothetical protein
VAITGRRERLDQVTHDAIPSSCGTARFRAAVHSPGHAAFIGEKAGIRMFYHYHDRQQAGLPVIGDRPLIWTAESWRKIK